MTFVLTGPGSIGMEASFVNLVEPGDKVVICINGVFGDRMRNICERTISMQDLPIDYNDVRPPYGWV